MITINIDRSTHNKKEMADYLINVIREIQDGQTIGDDWEIHGDEVYFDEMKGSGEPDDFTGATPGDR